VDEGEFAELVDHGDRYGDFWRRGPFPVDFEVERGRFPLYFFYIPPAGWAKYLSRKVKLEPSLLGIGYICKSQHKLK
jgi:hypothetical protein